MEDRQTVANDVGGYIVAVFDLKEDDRNEAEMLKEMGGIIGGKGLPHHLHKLIDLLFYLLRYKDGYLVVVMDIFD